MWGLKGEGVKSGVEDSRKGKSERKKTREKIQGKGGGERERRRFRKMRKWEMKEGKRNEGKGSIELCS